MGRNAVEQRTAIKNEQQKHESSALKSRCELMQFYNLLSAASEVKQFCIVDASVSWELYIGVL